MPLIPNPKMFRPRLDGRFDSVRDELKAFNPLHVAAAAGALSLVPANGARLLRLSALASLAATQPARKGEWLKRTKVDSLVNAGALASLGWEQDDPPEDVLTEEVVFHHRAYRAASGSSENGVWALRALIRALLLSDILPDPLRARLTDLVGAGLALSDYLLVSAAIPTHKMPERTADGRIVVPPPRSFQALAGLVSFATDELDAITAPWPARSLLDLTLRTGERSVSDDDVAAGKLDGWPLLTTGNEVVVAQPYAIVGALRHHLLSQAIKAVGEDAIASAWRASVTVDVSHDLMRIGISPKRSDEADWTVFRGKLDRDVDLVCVVLADDMKHFDPAEVYGMFDSRALVERAHQRFEVEAKQTKNHVVGLLVVAGAGRGGYFGVPDEEQDRLTTILFAAPDFEAFAMLETDEPASLWRFGRALQTLRAGPRVTTFSTLDTYGVYLDHDRSFEQVADATAVMVAPGSGGRARAESKRIRGRTGLRYVDGTVREVERRSDSDDDPFRFPVQVTDSRPLISAAEAPLPIWVRGWAGGDSSAWVLLETVCYWLWELSRSAPQVFHNRQRAQAVRVDVELEGGNDWFDPGNSDGGGKFGSFASTEAGVTITLGRSARHALATDDNAGERQLVELLITGLASWGGSANANLDGVLDAVAPLGIKKHLLIMSRAANPLLDRSSTIGAPTIVPDSRSRARHLLAQKLKARFGYQNELVPKDQTDAVARGAVDELLSEIERRAGEMTSAGLLELLLERTESLIAEGQFLRATLPSRNAAFPELAEADVFRSAILEVNEAAICTRFVSEYVAAIPPSGPAPVSNWRVDDLVALVAEMLGWAYFDDATHWGLNAVGLLVREDGQLRLQELGAYDHGRVAFFDRHLASQRDLAAEQFPSLFADPPPANDGANDEPRLVHRVNQLFIGEAGVTFTELSDLLAAAHWQAVEAGLNVMAVPFDQAVDALGQELGWSRAKLEGAVRWLVLEPRAVFLKPPGGSWRDAVPSRFARRWSINRRPFVIRDGGGARDLMWGQRQVLATSYLLHSQLHDGRMAKLVSDGPLLAELGAIAVEAGHQFEAHVASLFRDNGEFRTAPAVDRFGTDKLERANGEDLGDIDVLIGHLPSRTLWAAECKDLAGSITPSEVIDDLTSHFELRPKSSASKHGERLAWLQARIPQALSLLGIEAGGGWTARGVFIVSAPSQAPLIRELPFPVVPDTDAVEFVRTSGGTTAKRGAATSQRKPNRKRRHKPNK